MITDDIAISRQDGFHARPAGEFVKAAAKYQSKILICQNDKQISGKSIIGVMSLILKHGDIVRLVIDGEDELAAYQELSAIL